MIFSHPIVSIVSEEMLTVPDECKSSHEPYIVNMASNTTIGHRQQQTAFSPAPTVAWRHGRLCWVGPGLTWRTPLAVHCLT